MTRKAEILASIKSGVEDIAAGRFTPLGTREEFIARARANHANKSIRRDMEAEIRASINRAEEDIAAGRVRLLGTVEEEMARVHAAYKEKKLK